MSSCEIFSCPFSDHCAVQYCVSVPDVVPPGPGLWKQNTSNLGDYAYIESVSSFWLSWKCRQLDFPSSAGWWEEGKSRIKGLTICYCVSRAQLCLQSRDLLVPLVDQLSPVWTVVLFLALGHTGLP